MKRPDKIKKLAVRILHALLAATNGREAERPTLACIRAELEQLQNEFKESDFNLDTVTVSVITSPITLEGIYLGPFRIQLNIDKISSGAPADCFDVIAMEPHPAADSPHVTHPHVSAERLCTGDATAPLSKALMSGRVCDFFLLIHSVLNAYNSDSPYVPLEEWEGEYCECYNCGLRIRTDESYKCPSCNRWFCKGCITSFPCCDLQICSICLQDMKYVDQTGCKDCSVLDTYIYALSEAVKRQRACAVEIMIEGGWDVNGWDENDKKPLDIAIQLKNTEIVELLRAHGAMSSLPKPTISLHEAAEKGKIEQIKRSLYWKWAINAWDSRSSYNTNTPLHLAVQKGQNDVVELLLSNGANPDGWRQTINEFDEEKWDKCEVPPLHYAVQSNQETIIELLLDNGANVDSEDSCGRTALHEAATVGSNTIVEQLIAKGADINKKGGHIDCTPLHEAVEAGAKTVVEALINHGAQINALDCFGSSPLHKAAENGQVDIVKVLLDHNPGVNIKGGHTESTPLHCAIKSGHEIVVNMLLINGADVTARDNTGQTPLHLASEHGLHSLVEQLIRKEADINAKNNQGMTPLHKAAEYAKTKVVEVLLANSADTCRFLALLFVLA